MAEKSISVFFSWQDGTVIYHRAIDSFLEMKRR
jgi:hypothetical protein